MPTPRKFTRAAPVDPDAVSKLPKIRKPGERLSLTGDVLRDCEDPTILASLTGYQLAERRRLKRAAAKKARDARRAPKGAKKTPMCRGKTEAGTPCPFLAMSGNIYCELHLTVDDREKLGIKSVKIPRQKAPEMMRTILEASAAKIIEPYLKALGVEFLGYSTVDGTPIINIIPGGGIKLHGESKEGDIIMTDYDNITAMVAVAERLLNRVYGTPTKTTVIEGGKSPLRVVPVRTEERAVEVARLLARSGAIPPTAPHTNGRKRAQPSEPPARSINGKVPE